jgi:peptidoglycan-N-acetylglucosamine deacetylase
MWHGPAVVEAASVAGRRRLVALTYDDGPNPHNTLRLLEILGAYAAKATFFVIGHRVESRREILRQTFEAGHEIGNHTYSHKRMPLKGSKAVRREIELAEDLIEQVTGSRSKLVRPPFGRAVRAYARASSSLGLQTVLWSVDPRDWDDISADEIVARTLAKVRPGSIILMHDSGPLRMNVLDGTREVLHRLSVDGYKFVTVSELLAADSTVASDASGFCQSTVR